MQNNSKLVGEWGNFVNPTFTFAAEYLNNEIPTSTINSKVAEKNQYRPPFLRWEDVLFTDAAANDVFAILLSPECHFSLLQYLP